MVPAMQRARRGTRRSQAGGGYHGKDGAFEPKRERERCDSCCSLQLMYNVPAWQRVKAARSHDTVSQHPKGAMVHEINPPALEHSRASGRGTRTAADHGARNGNAIKGRAHSALGTLWFWYSP